MSTISINGNVLAEQPTSLNEAWVAVGTTQTSISGNKQRIQFPGRKRVVMSWKFAKPETVRLFRRLEDAGSAVTYENDNSAFYGGTSSFTGILSVSPAAYQRGGSGLSELSVTIEEGEAYVG